MTDEIKEELPTPTAYDLAHKKVDVSVYYPHEKPILPITREIDDKPKKLPTMNWDKGIYEHDLVKVEREKIKLIKFLVVMAIVVFGTIGVFLAYNSSEGKFGTYINQGINVTSSFNATIPVTNNNDIKVSPIINNNSTINLYVNNLNVITNSS